MRYDCPPNLTDPATRRVMFDPIGHKLVLDCIEVGQVNQSILVCTGKCECSGHHDGLDAHHDCYGWGFGWTSGLCWTCFEYTVIFPMYKQIEPLQRRAQLALQAISHHGPIGTTVQRGPNFGVPPRTPNGSGGTGLPPSSRSTHPVKGGGDI